MKKKKSAFKCLDTPGIEQNIVMIALTIQVIQLPNYVLTPSKLICLKKRSIEVLSLFVWEKIVLILIFLTFAFGMSPLYFSVKSRICLNEPHETVIRIRGLREPNL